MWEVRPPGVSRLVTLVTLKESLSTCFAYGLKAIPGAQTSIEA